MQNLILTFFSILSFGFFSNTYGQVVEVSLDYGSSQADIEKLFNKAKKGYNKKTQINLKKIKEVYSCSNLPTPKFTSTNQGFLVFDDGSIVMVASVDNIASRANAAQGCAGDDCVCIVSVKMGDDDGTKKGTFDQKKSVKVTVKSARDILYGSKTRSPY